MITNDELAILIPVVDMIVSFSVAFFTYKWLQYKNEQMIKKKHPTKDNGHNLDYSFRIEGGEVVGIHLRGATAQELLDKILTLIFGEGEQLKHIKITKNTIKTINTERLYKRLFEIKELSLMIKKELRFRDRELNRVVR